MHKTADFVAIRMRGEALRNTSYCSIVTDSRFSVDFVGGRWYDKDAGRAVLQPPFFPCSGKIVSCLLVFLKNPRIALCSRFAGAFLYLFDNHPDFAYNLDTVHFFLVKSPEKSTDNL